MNNTGRLNCWVEFLFVNVNRVSHKTERLYLGLRISPQLRKSQPAFVLKIEKSRREGNGSAALSQRCKLYELCSGPHMFRLLLRYASLIYSPTNSTCTFVRALELVAFFQDTIPMFVPFYCLRKKQNNAVFQELFFYVARSQ